MCKGIFHGKRLDNGEWVEGFYATNPEWDRRLYGEHHWITSCKNAIKYEVDPDTVGQYTGLKDCKDKPVFEGDIVRLFSDVKRTFDISDGEVKWCRGAFVVGNGDGFRSSLSVVASYDWVLRGEVIGNIHDNPELLEP